MHLFALGVGLDPSGMDRLADELHRTASLYPQLDHDAAWQRRLPNGVFVGGVASPSAVAAPRVYVHAAEREIVFYDGLPIDASPGGIRGHVADELARSWDELIPRLEGRFGIIRASLDGSRVSLINDAFGAMQLYVAEPGGATIVSNSAGLVARAIDARELDPLGVSTFLAIDWVGADRTLRAGVRVLPGAQDWQWTSGGGWTRRRYWHYSDGEPPTRRVDDAYVDEMTDALGRFVTGAAAINGTINSPLTGGKDSRMLAAILMSTGIPVQYWTKGLPESLDVQIALEIARQHGLQHRLSGRPTEPPGHEAKPVAEDWESLTSQFVSQNDGLPSLHLVGNIQGQPDRVDHLAVTLSAMCAESTRRATAQTYLDAPGASLERAERYIPYAWLGIPRGLVKGEAFRLARDHLRDLVQRHADEGVSLKNLSNVVYLDERCRRWAPNNPRELAQTEDKVLPFLTRPYLEAALRSDPEDRASHQVHRRVIRRLVPELEHEPRLDKPWFTEPEELGTKRKVTNDVMSRLPYTLRRGIVATRDRIRPPRPTWERWTAYDEASWLEPNLGWARDVALSSPSSRLWDYIDRPHLERLLNPATHASERRVHQLALFASLTIFAYEDFERRLRAGQPSMAAPGEDATAHRAADASPPSEPDR